MPERGAERSTHPPADAILPDKVETLPLPPTAPHPGKSALAFFGVLLLLFLPGVLAQSALLPAGLAWTQLFAFLLPALVATTGSNLQPRAYLRLGPVRPALLAAGAAAGVPAYLVAGATMLALQRLLPASWAEAFDPARLFAGPPWERAALAFVAVAIAPPCEEIAFRGYLQTSLALRRRPAAAIGGSALLFALLHLDPVRFPAVLVLGVVFGWLTFRSGSVWPAVAAHAVNNAITSALFFTVGVSEEEPDTSALALTMALGLSLLAPILLAFRAATRSPPDASEAVVLRDPIALSTDFSLERVPSRLQIAALVGMVALGLLVLGAVFSEARPAR